MTNLTDILEAWALRALNGRGGGGEARELDEYMINPMAAFVRWNMRSIAFHESIIVRILWREWYYEHGNGD